MTMLGDDLVTARKRHRCFVCKCSIWPGTKYRRSSFVGDDGPYRIVEHQECARVAGNMCDSFDYSDGYQGEDVYESMHDAFTQWPRAGDINVYMIGDMTDDERVVWARFRSSMARYEIRIAMKNDRWIK